MTLAVAGALAALVLASALLAFAVLRSRRRAAARSARANVALSDLATTMHRAAAELERAVRVAERRPRLVLEVDDTTVAALDPATGLPGRTAFVDALRRQVADARADDRRLALALVAAEGAGIGLEEAMRRVATAARETTPAASVYRVGEHALALLLAGVGRADAIGAVARIEAALHGEPPRVARAGELEHGEDAIALLARVTALDTGGTGGDPRARIPT
ncbi:MAG: hypothetical protein ACRC50_06460 [Gaiella sp.]